jgi:flagellar assembly protein FliH
MTDHAKFLFQTRFEAGMRPAPAPRNNFTAAELEAARKAGEQAGHAAGRAKAMAEIEARAAASLDRLVAGMAGTLEQINARHDEQTRETLATTVEILRKLFPTLANRHEAAEVEALLAECVALMPDEPRIVVRVPEALDGQIRPRFERTIQRTGFAGQVTLIADPALSDGQSRIEWSEGGVGRDTTRLWAEIDTVIARFANPASGPDQG